MSSPYLTSKEAAEFLRYKSVGGFRKAARRHRIPCIRRDRDRLYLKADLINAWTHKLPRLPAQVGKRSKDDAA